MTTTTTPTAAAASTTTAPSSSTTGTSNNKPCFPIQDLIPKGDTGVGEFCRRYGSNGSRCRVGILDTGIDPNAAGLQFMTDGVTRKLINVIDCTGSGDVDCSFETTATTSLTSTSTTGCSSNSASSSHYSQSSCYQVTGLSGHVLLLPTEWTFKAFPGVVTDQKLNNNEKKKSSKSSSGAVDATAAAAAAADAAGPVAADEKAENMTNANEMKDDINANANPNTIESSNTSTTTVQVRLGIKRAYELYPSKLKTRLQQERLKVLQEKLSPLSAAARAALVELQSIPKPTPAQKLQIAEQQERLKILQEQLPDDPGPLYDLVVFWDGTHYRVALYLQGQLITPKPLTDFDQEYQFVNMCTASQMNVAVHFYNHGKTVSLVSDASPHGTHVAGICASAASESKNQGVAPGAELVSLKIGDSRLGSMETGAALTRALQQAIRLKCDVVNLSYGEGCQVPDTGRFVELLEEMVYKHNITFVSSAGNNGPALSTVSAPGGTSTATIGVAAHVSPDSMRVNYSMKPEEFYDVDKRNDNHDDMAASKNNDSDDGIGIVTPTSSDTAATNTEETENTWAQHILGAVSDRLPMVAQVSM